MSEYKNGVLIGGADPETISCIWGRPANPHAYDDEFDSGTLDPAWSWSAYYGAVLTVDTDPIDVYNTYSTATNQVRYDVNIAQQQSWLRMQPDQGTAVAALLSKAIYPVTVPTNFLVYARIRFQQDFSTAGNEQMVGIRLDLEAYNNQYVIAMQESDGTVQAEAWAYNGSTSDVDTETTDVAAQGQALQYVALQKLNTTYHFWVGTSSNWIHMGSSSHATGAVTRVGLFAANTLGDKPWVSSFDFIRFIETDKFLIG